MGIIPAAFVKFLIPESKSGIPESTKKRPDYYPVFL